LEAQNAPALASLLVRNRSGCRCWLVAEPSGCRAERLAGWLLCRLAGWLVASWLRLRQMTATKRNRSEADRSEATAAKRTIISNNHKKRQ